MHANNTSRTPCFQLYKLVPCPIYALGIGTLGSDNFTCYVGERMQCRGRQSVWLVARTLRFTDQLEIAIVCLQFENREFAKPVHLIE